MSWHLKKRKARRHQVHQKRAKSEAALRAHGRPPLSVARLAAGAAFVGGVIAIALIGQGGMDYSIGQRLDHPVYAAVQFQVSDPVKTEENRRTARAATPSYYTPQASAAERIRADLLWLYQAAANANAFEGYAQAVQERGWPAEERAYQRLRVLAEQPAEAGRAHFTEMVNALPLEEEYVVRGMLNEPREPRSTTDYIVLLVPEGEGTEPTQERIPKKDLVPQETERALRGSASEIARRLGWQLESTVEEIVLAALREQPTIVMDQTRTVAEMRRAEDETKEALTTYEKDKMFLRPGIVLGSEEYQLLAAHQAAYKAFLDSDDPEAAHLRRQLWLQRGGLAVLLTVLSIGLLVYTDINHRRVFEVRSRAIAFMFLILGALAACQVLNGYWPQVPELILAPCVVAASVLAIAYPRRFAVGAACITVVLVVAAVHRDLILLLTLFAGVAASAHQLDEVRSRTKLIAVGIVTAFATALATTAGGLVGGHAPSWFVTHVSWAASSSLLAMFIVSGILPFIEQAFGIATSLTLLEWRDPTKPLLQLLAREAPGTYNHSLVLGTLAEAACERIGVNGLLAQVGALYHDIGKIHKADYFAENQEGGINRHDNLAPTMSLLIILGHVKDGMEMAKEYKLPRVLHQFIAEHHGTTVVRYFHHVASEQQPKIASGRHDREVPEAEFRYAGPKPRTRESAVVMMCDGVEGAVRALKEPTVGRIEGVVHQIVTARLNDGQLSDCDMTMREIRQVEESLVKSLCSIYHGRVAYPKAAKRAEQQERMTV